MMTKKVHQPFEEKIKSTPPSENPCYAYVSLKKPNITHCKEVIMHSTAKPLYTLSCKCTLWESKMSNFNRNFYWAGKGVSG